MYLIWLFTLISFSLLLSSCADLAYYRQTVAGQWALLDARRPIAAILADPATPPKLRQQLEIAHAVRQFAHDELQLTDSGSYQHYADLQRPYAVKTVLAAPELALELRQWCYWLVGCLGYRGFFDAAAAERFAATQRSAGDDVYVAAVPAYSTLGWFADPVLNTFVDWPPARLAELIFHELAHQRLYIADDTAFNEAFATAVGRLGVERWLRLYGTVQAQQAYATDRQRQEVFLDLVATTRQRLAAVYAASLTDTAKRLKKREILAQMQALYRELKRDWGGYSGYDRWFEQDLNNAKLAGNSAYYHWVPAFLRLYEQTGADMVAFYQAAETLGRLPFSQRVAELEARLPSAARLRAQSLQQPIGE